MGASPAPGVEEDDSPAAATSCDARPCRGLSCASFSAGFSCSELAGLGCDCAGCCIAPPHAPPPPPPSPPAPEPA
eukprot:6014443-Prymnesium_polylepis.1